MVLNLISTGRKDNAKARLFLKLPTDDNIYHFKKNVYLIFNLDLDQRLLGQEYIINKYCGSLAICLMGE